MWQVESVAGTQEFVPLFLYVLCAGTEQGWYHVLLLSRFTLLQLAYAADTGLLPLLPVRLLNSNQELELDFSLFLLECLTATYLGLAL